jgi:hypothetical protein
VYDKKISFRVTKMLYASGKWKQWLASKLLAERKNLFLNECTEKK